ncbi:spore coat protein U domain-containing protein [Aquicoccus sp. SU-CL01552]|uniref:spore coat protein U domain-containing protein n=1 Tax=Aquicoccus sp. SU-CL01552 TaxID=3127656 RepID=UPI00310C79CD
MTLLKGSFLVTSLSTAAFLTATAQAAVEEGTLNVTATVIAQCTVTTSAVAFGEISPTQAASATGSISISCDDDNTLSSVILDGGSYESGGTRQMSDGGTEYIPYTLAVGGSPVAVNGDIGSSFTLAGTGPYSDSVDIDGAIGSVAAPGRELGSYSDSITVTVTYTAP